MQRSHIQNPHIIGSLSILLTRTVGVTFHFRTRSIQFSCHSNESHQVNLEYVFVKMGEVFLWWWTCFSLHLQLLLRVGIRRKFPSHSDPCINSRGDYRWWYQPAILSVPYSEAEQDCYSKSEVRVSWLKLPSILHFK